MFLPVKFYAREIKLISSIIKNYIDNLILDQKTIFFFILMPLVYK